MKKFLTPLFVLMTTAALAQSYDLSWHTINGGGGTSTSGTLTLSATIGQSDATPPPSMSGGSFQLTGGFWSGAPSATCTLLGDMNHDGRVDGEDIQLFVTCVMGAGGSCGCADFDGGGVGTSDIAAFVTALLS